MGEGNIKPKLVALVKTGADEQRAFVAGLTDAQRTQVGTPQRWSAKDNLAHIAFWQKHLVGDHQTLERGETPPQLPDDNEQNQIIFQMYRDQTWSEVNAAAESAYKGLLALLEGYSEADLTTPNRLPSPRDYPLWRDFLSSGYSHPVFHYADFYLEHGDVARATTLQIQLAKGTASLGDDDARGVADYNLACFYAKSGQKDAALALLPNALKLSPRLVEWSKEDPDLVSLHGDAVYQGLYT